MLEERLWHLSAMWLLFGLFTCGKQDYIVDPSMLAYSNGHLANQHSGEDHTGVSTMPVNPDNHVHYFKGLLSVTDGFGSPPGASQIIYHSVGEIQTGRDSDWPAAVSEHRFALSIKNRDFQQNFASETKMGLESFRFEH